jgi:hypothetical protein
MSTGDEAQLFDEYLAEALSHPDAVQGTEAMATEGGYEPRAKIRTSVEAERERILKETTAHALARAAAADRHAAIVEKLRFEDRRYRVLAVLGVVLMALAIAAAATLSAKQQNVNWWWLAGVVAYGCFLPWVIAMARRSFKRLSRLPGRERERDMSDKRYRSVLGDEVTASVRRAINVELSSLSTTFKIIDMRGLRELTSPEREVSTAATRELRDLMNSLDGGSLGISGPRGAGKTTLLHSFATGRSLLDRDAERRGLVVSAPVRYDARDFVLHLYASVCERVLYPDAAGTGTRPRPVQLRAAARAAAFRKFLWALAAMCAVIGGAFLLFNRTAPSNPREAGTLLLIVAGVAAYFGWGSWWAFSVATDPPRPEHSCGSWGSSLATMVTRTGPPPSRTPSQRRSPSSDWRRSASSRRSHRAGREPSAYPSAQSWPGSPS